MFCVVIECVLGKCHAPFLLCHYISQLSHAAWSPGEENITRMFGGGRHSSVEMAIMVSTVLAVHRNERLLLPPLLLKAPEEEEASIKCNIVSCAAAAACIASRCAGGIPYRCNCCNDVLWLSLHCTDMHGLLRIGPRQSSPHMPPE